MNFYTQIEVAHAAVTCLHHAEEHLIKGAKLVIFDSGDYEAVRILRKLRYWESMDVSL